MKSDDFRFCINSNGVTGCVIFNQNDAEQSVVKFKGYAVGLAQRYCKTTRRPQPGVCNPAFFFMFARKINDNSGALVSDFLIHEFTGITDMVGDKIFLRDILYDCDNMQKVMVKKFGGSYYVEPLEIGDNRIKNIRLLTNKVDYSIVGNEFEGEIDATWEFQK